jgi:hypothetical protein
LPAAATVKAIGMWGAANQIYVHPAGLGFVPSPDVSATYAGSVTPPPPPPPPVTYMYISPLGYQIIIGKDGTLTLITPTPLVPQ